MGVAGWCALVALPFDHLIFVNTLLATGCVSDFVVFLVVFLQEPVIHAYTRLYRQTIYRQ